MGSEEGIVKKNFNRMVELMIRLVVKLKKKLEGPSFLFLHIYDYLRGGNGSALGCSPTWSFVLLTYS